MNTTRRTIVLLAVSAGLLLLAEPLAIACPNCKDGLASDPAQAGLVRGLFYSIIFLLSMPFLITAGMGAYFYWLVRKARKTSVHTTEPTSPFAYNDARSTVQQPELELVDA